MLAEDTIEIKIAGILTQSVESMGYEIVRIRLQGSGEARALQIMIERADGAMITVDDCEKVSKQVSALLDVEDPLQDAYNLEISSPGVDRPLTRPKDFVKFAGFDVKLETREKIDGQARFRGRLVGLEDEQVVLDLNVIDMARPGVPKRVKLDFNSIRNAKLILTDELMAAFAKEINLNKKDK